MKHRNALLASFAALVVLAGAGAVLTSCSAGAANAAGGSSASINVVVLCSSCGIPGNASTPHLILLDQQTGDVWAYRELDEQPVSLGRLTQIGAPVQKP